MKLTDSTVRELACPDGKKDAMFFDETLKGFGVRVMPNRADGTPRKVFLLQYRIGAKVRREPLGDWGTEITTVQARRRAETLRGIVRDRRDPVAERKEAQAAEATKAAATKAAVKVEAFTLSKLVTAWQTRALVNRRETYSKEAVARVRQGFAKLMERPAAAITRTEAAKAIQDIATNRGPIGANRAMAYARACYGWAMKANVLEVNPFAGLAAPGKERARDRVLTGPEVSAIWAAADKLSTVHSAYVRFLMLTLQRRDEVAGATWSEISDDRLTWTIPAERAKNGRAHLVHLTEPARAIIGALPRGKRQLLVFSLPGAGKLTAFSAIKTALDLTTLEAEAEAALRANREPIPMPGWTFHDFRRTGVTVQAGQGFAPHVCDRLLNHVTGAIQGVAAVYQRAEFLEERKAALEAWAGWCCGMKADSTNT